MDKVSNKDLWGRTNQIQIEIDLATHCEKAKQQHYKTGLDVESSRQEKERRPKPLGDVTLRQTSNKRAELATTGEDCPAQET